MNQRHIGIGMTSQRTRERMVVRLREAGIADQHVLDIMRTTPRHIFVDEALASRAYEDSSLPIGFAQTISQPFIVAFMTQALLNGQRLKKVLEIGTGSGYQTSILAQLVDEVYTVERIQGLQERARRTLRELKLTNIRYKYDDGNMGWAEHAPFDGIIVTAAPPEIPPGLLQQLGDQARLIIPAGQAGEQVLRCITRNDDQFTEEILHQVSFVPMLGGTS